jgi:hypothetical protein
VERNYTLHVGQAAELADVWMAFLTADIFIMSKSSFSLVPAMLNTKAKVIYTPFLAPTAGGLGCGRPELAAANPARSGPSTTTRWLYVVLVLLESSAASDATARIL